MHMFKNRIAALALGLLATSSTALADDVTWYADYDQAVAAAKETGKNLFIDFTGSDWCGWCVRLEEEVFSKEEFLSSVQKDYILVALDFPRSPDVQAKVPNPERNSALQAKYGVRGFPTILLMTPEGHAYGQMGYEKGGPENYLEILASTAKEGMVGLAEVKQTLGKFEEAAGADKETAWKNIVEKFEASFGKSLLSVSYIDSIVWAIDYDADNAKGMQRMAIDLLLEKGAATEKVFTSAMKLDPKNEEGLYEQVVQSRFMTVSSDETAKAAMTALDALAALGFKDSKVGFGMHLQAAMWCSGPLEDAEAAKKHAAAAKAIGSDDERAMKELDKILNG